MTGGGGPRQESAAAGAAHPHPPPLGRLTGGQAWQASGSVSCHTDIGVVIPSESGNLCRARDDPERSEVLDLAGWVGWWVVCCTPTQLASLLPRLVDVGLGPSRGWTLLG